MKELLEQNAILEGSTTDRYFNLIEQAADGIAIVQDGAFKLVNSALVRISGYDEGELLGMPFIKLVAPESQKLAMARYQDRLAGKEVPSSYQIKAITRDGEIRDIEINAALTEYEGWAADEVIIRDITERRQAEEALRQAKEQFQALVEESPLGISIVDEDGYYQYVNPKFVEIFGYTLEDFATRQEWFVKVYPDPEYRNMVTSSVSDDVKSTEHGERSERIFTVTCKDGTEKLIHFRPVVLESGLRFVTCEDVTERKQAEEALRESKLRYRTLFNASSDAVFVHHPKPDNKPGKLIEVNDAACQMLGYTREELFELSPVDFTKRDEAGLSPTEEVVTSLFAHKRTLFERIFIAKDGCEVPVEISSHLFELQGKPTIITIARDITERKRMEEEVRESEERFRIASQITSDVVYERDLQTGIATFYGDIDTHLGYDPGEYPRTWEGWREHVHPEDLARIESMSIDQMEPGVPHRIEYRMRKKDGTYITWLDRVMMILDEKTGAPLKFIGAATDITEHKRAEQALADEATRRRILVEQSRDGIVVLDQNGKVFEANHRFSQMLGYSPEEILKLHAWDWDTQWTKAQLLEMIGGVDAAGDHFETYHRRKDGTIFDVEISTNGAIIADQKLVFCVCRDITERKEAEEKEKQLQQEVNLSRRLASIGEMASGVAHEINNPLTSVIGFSQLLMSQDIPGDIRGDLAVINSEAQRVAKIVGGLLTFAHQRKPGQDYVDINNIISEVLKLRSYEMEVNNIQVVTQLAPDLPQTIADGNQLQQVFLNIIMNAEKEMITEHDRGKLLVKTEKKGNTIRISFADDGPGISQENLDKIFDPFFTTREVGNGTGLGLSICHGIITAHNGKIHAESVLGKGATFTVELPILGDIKLTESVDLIGERPRKQGEAKILAVDDETAILHFLKRLLTDEGYVVETVDKAHMALERTNKEKYDLILMDIKMPVMSGIELYRHIEATDPSLARRVLFITGDTMETTTRDFLDVTGVTHITKPINIERLKKEINHILMQDSNC